MSKPSKENNVPDINASAKVAILRPSKICLFRKIHNCSRIHHCLKSVPLLFIPIEKNPRNLEVPTGIKEFRKGISIPVLNEFFQMISK